MVSRRRLRSVASVALGLAWLLPVHAAAGKDAPLYASALKYERPQNFFRLIYPGDPVCSLYARSIAQWARAWPHAINEGTGNALTRSTAEIPLRPFDEAEVTAYRSLGFPTFAHADFDNSGRPGLVIFLEEYSGRDLMLPMPRLRDRAYAPLDRAFSADDYVKWAEDPSLLVAMARAVGEPLDRFREARSRDYNYYVFVRLNGRIYLSGVVWPQPSVYLFLIELKSYNQGDLRCAFRNARALIYR